MFEAARANERNAMTSRTGAPSARATSAAAPRRRPPRDSLTTQVARDLAVRIDSGDLKAGSQLPPERELMERYGVSRTVVREATSSLRASGRVATHQGRGAFVLSPPLAFRFTIDPEQLSTLRDVLHVMDVRLAVEAEAASLAASRHSAAQLAAIHAALAALAANLRKPSGNSASDVAFHLAIAAATGNAYFTQLLTELAPRLLPRQRLDLFGDNRRRKLEYLTRLQQEHTDIFLAIERRDPDAARAAMRLHLSNSRERLRLAFEQR
jgi:GntR family transcriptional regulator, transcriptional repressor for pyruvate dehydrogenase complex